MLNFCLSHRPVEAVKPKARLNHLFGSWRHSMRRLVSDRQRHNCSSPAAKALAWIEANLADLAQALGRGAFMERARKGIFMPDASLEP